MLTKTLLITLFASSLLAAEPEKLIKLRGSYESAMTKATAPIQKTYTTELEKLKIEFTKAGNLEAAIAVDSELTKLVPTKTSLTNPTQTAKNRKLTKKQIEKLLVEGSWLLMEQVDSPTTEASAGAKTVFKGDGNMIQPDGRTHGWNIDSDGTIKLFTEAFDRYGFILTFTSENDFSLKRAGKSWNASNFSRFIKIEK